MLQPRRVDEGRMPSSPLSLYSIGQGQGERRWMHGVRLVDLLAHSLARDWWPALGW